MTRQIVLVGAEVEENFSIRYLAAAVAENGVDSVIVPFKDAALGAATRRLAGYLPCRLTCRIAREDA
jgi:hypothetical protein